MDPAARMSASGRKAKLRALWEDRGLDLRDDQGYRAPRLARGRLSLRSRGNHFRGSSSRGRIRTSVEWTKTTSPATRRPGIVTSPHSTWSHTSDRDNSYGLASSPRIESAVAPAAVSAGYARPESCLRQPPALRDHSDTRCWSFACRDSANGVHRKFIGLCAEIRLPSVA